MFETILLAVDGSEHGQHAAKIAGDLARVVKAKDLRIVVAFEPIPSYLGEPNLGNVIAARKTEAEKIMQKAQEAIGKVPAPAWVLAASRQKWTWSSALAA